MKNSTSSSSIMTVFTKFIIYFILFSLLVFLFHHYINNLKPYRDKQSLLLENRPAVHLLTAERIKNRSAQIAERSSIKGGRTELNHIVFGIAASSKLWENRKNYVKLWWQQERMRGYVWLDSARKESGGCSNLPPVRISSNTSRFKYRNKKGSRSAIRLTRIVSETLRLGEENLNNDVRWIVLGDDDTFFVPENLVRVLRKYDHNQFYYIGSISETHLQNVRFSFDMAYGGGGFAISYPLAVALEKIQDRCIERYSELYGSDDRIQACMSEVGVPLTKEIGFHQLDLFNNVFGLLAAHPIAPLVSLHHLDVIQPIFPNMNQLQALKKLTKPIKLDSAALFQQSICYNKARNWTVSVSWGFVVQIVRGIIPPREMEIPVRTFLNWYRQNDETSFVFNTRPWNRSDCHHAPFVYVLKDASYNVLTNQTISEYTYHPNPNPKCDPKIPDPSRIRRVYVHKKPNPFLWEKAPRRNCCRVLSSKKEGTMEVDVGECKDGEVIEL